MTTLRNRSNSIFIALALAGLASGAAHAQEARPTQQAMHAQWGERAAQHQQQLHDLLKLTPSQDSAWTSYVAAVKPQPHEQHERHGDWKNLAAPQRMEKQIDMAKQHIAKMESHLSALNTFYSVLTPEQKKVFDTHSMGMGMHHGGRHQMQG